MEDKERWPELCEQAAGEEDGEKLAALVKEIDGCWERKTSE
jgi:hypothetical protein